MVWVHLENDGGFYALSTDSIARSIKSIGHDIRASVDLEDEMCELVEQDSPVQSSIWSTEGMALVFLIIGSLRHLKCDISFSGYHHHIGSLLSYSFDNNLLNENDRARFLNRMSAAKTVIQIREPTFFFLS